MFNPQCDLCVCTRTACMNKTCIIKITLHMVKPHVIVCVSTRNKKDESSSLFSGLHIEING